MNQNLYIFGVLFFLLTACHSDKGKFHKNNVHGEYLYRKSSDLFFTPSPPTPKTKENYLWERFSGTHARITKEFFRCKGNLQNPAVTQTKDGKILNRYYDCSGGEHHGLPLKEEKEFIYPCLIDLLNYIQNKTQKRVVITSGHRCPTHNAYCDPSTSNVSSKHMLGAEVDFFVEGLEEQPLTVIALVFDYYKNHPDFRDKKEYLDFQRYQKKGLNVSTPPWHNKEVFIKLYLKTEGRNQDNTHTNPYIGIQVRYDKDLEKPVVFDSKQAQNYLRH